MKYFHVQLVGADGVGLDTQFDDVCRQLAAIDRLYIELDGSFVWTGDSKIDGMIYDCNERLRYIEMKGWCSRAFWQALTKIFCGEKTIALIVCLPNGGLYDLQTFEEMTWQAT